VKHQPPILKNALSFADPLFFDAFETEPLFSLPRSEHIPAPKITLPKLNDSTKAFMKAMQHVLAPGQRPKTPPKREIELSEIAKQFGSHHEIIPAPELMIQAMNLELKKVEKNSNSAKKGSGIIISRYQLTKEELTKIHKPSVGRYLCPAYLFKKTTGRSFFEKS